MCDAIGQVACQQILVVHAISGCDTTSSLFGQGKSGVWKKTNKNKAALKLSVIIESCESSHNDVVSAGLKLMVMIYGGQSTDSLNHLRYSTYMTKTASCSAQPRPERLPPTEAAATYHLYRVHLQVVQWKTFMTTNLKPEEWGWILNEGRYEPMMTSLPAAPDELLSVVRCKCKIEGRRPCSTQLCSCIKHGLSCVSACSHCNGEHCGNEAKPSSIVEAECSDAEPEPEFILDDLVPEDCMQFDIPWLDEEEVRQVILFNLHLMGLILHLEHKN